ncbi:MAG TPA: amidohydrolase family protein [Umezawaea sp.]|nr:amidohydrolase family protein [Umezawaea sp.]
MIVDAHHHLWDLDVRDQDWITDPPMGVLRRNFRTADLEAVAEANGIARTVLVQTITVPEETPEFLAVAEESDVVGAVVGWTDLTAPDVAESLAGLAEVRGGSWLRGIRHQVQGEPDPEWLCRKDVWRGLTAVGRAGLVYELLTLPRQLPAARRTAAALPNVRFVVDHCSKPPIASGDLAEWAEPIRSLAAHDNVTCKVSGLVTEADWGRWTVEDLRPCFEVVLDAFGPERLMFGSDWPVCLLAAEYADVVAAARELTGELTEAERESVFSGTAVEVYGLTL